MNDFNRRRLFTGTRAAAALPTRMLMGYAETDLTDGANNGVPMGGYGWGIDRRSDGSTPTRRLRAQCMVLEDSQGGRIVLVRADVVSIPRQVYLDIRTPLMEAGVISSPANFVFNSSHTHTGPMIGKIPDPYVLLGSTSAVDVTNQYTSDFVSQIVQLVGRAAAGRTPVTMGWSEGRAYIGANRTIATWAPREVPVVTVRHADDGRPLAILYGHTCHPVCAVKGSTKLDSDFCGRASEEIQRRLDVPAMFFQGAAGDIEPPDTGGGGDPQIQSFGNQVADAVVASVRNNAYVPITGPFRNSYVEIQLPFSVNLADAAVRADLLARYTKRKSESAITDAELAGQRHAERMVSLLESNQVPKSMPMMVQRLSLGGLTVLALSHEVLSGYDVGTRRKFTRPLWIMAYANYVECYVPANDVLWASGYEAGWNPGDNTIAGVGTSANSYSLPAPLKAAPKDNPGAPLATEALVTSAIDRLLAG